MSKTEISLSILTENALESIKQMGMKESTVGYYRSGFSCISKYFTDCGNDHYDAETMARFLKELSPYVFAMHPFKRGQSCR